MRWESADEGRHDAAPGVEAWGFEVDGARVRGVIRLTFDVTLRRAAFVTDLVVGSADRIVVADEDVGLPRAAAGLEVRADGLWTSLYCETAFEHWTLGLEAFGLQVDRDATAPTWDALVGDRLPVGFDLEWEAASGPLPLTEGAGYRQAGVVHGTLALGRERLDIDGSTVREHVWGA